MILTRRNANLLAAVGCFALIAVAYFYFEKTEYLVPCPLCYAQRIVFGILGFVFLLVAVFPGSELRRKIYGIFLFLIACGGSALSIRHLYLQHLPKNEQPAACGQDFYALVQNTPLAEAVQTMLTGSGDCGEIQWELLGVSIPGWTLIAFIGFALWALFHNTFRGY